MKFLIRVIKRISILIVSTGVLWFIVTKIFEPLDQRINFFAALIITYVISAYIILPRIIYVILFILRKGKIPRFTRANDGFPVDPVNIILFGTKDELKNVFKKIEWYEADPLTIKSGLKMIKAFIFNKPYHKAPFSSLFLFGRKQDIGFQKSIDNSPRKRHHIRFWATNTNQIINPLDIKYWTKKQKIGHHNVFVWIGAGSKDIGFAFTKFTYEVSHKVDYHIDEERNHILSSLKKANCIGKIKYYNPGTFTIGKYISDGRIAVAKLI